MGSAYYKRRLINYFASWGTQQYVGAVFEAPNLWSADVVACRYSGKLSEFEIKVSRSDLLGEIAAVKRALEPQSVVTTTQNSFGFELGYEVVKVSDTKLSKTKVEKHHHYLVRPRKSFRPNQFYFAVPTGLVELAAENTKGLKYGVFDADKLTVVKRALSLHSDEHPNSTYIHLFNRLNVIHHQTVKDMNVARDGVLQMVAEHYDIEYDSVGYLRLMEVKKKWEDD